MVRPQTAAVVVYLGSATNVIPVLQHPEHDFVFVTPEPSHPVAVEHWPEGCVGWWELMQSREQLLDIIHACLGRSSWSMRVADRALAVFTRTSPHPALATAPARHAAASARRHQTLRVFTGVACDDMQDRARAEVLAADHYIMGFGGAAAVRARAEFFGRPGATASELLDPSDDLGRGGEFAPLQGGPPGGAGQEWTWVPHALDPAGNWVPTASAAILREHPGSAGAGGKSWPRAKL